MHKPAILALADGTVFEGVSVGADGRSVGEVVFNTAMSGYQEILTDPSYLRQLVTLTCSHVGNVGANEGDAESDGVKAAGLIVRDLPRRHSNYRATESLPDYLTRQGTVAIADVDTRELTRVLREKGAQAGCLMAGEGIRAEEAIAAAREFPGLAGMDLAREVTTAEPYEWRRGVWCHSGGMPEETSEAALDYHVVAYDFGIKRNILRLLVDAGCRVTVVPATTPATDVVAMNPDGVMLSNGPGDPEPCTYAIAAISALIEAGIPLFGICLGHQLLGLASGARTAKMKFGHHGANHPVRDADSGRVMITSQNHGFALDDDNLPANLRVTHRSLFDNTLQGIHRTDCSAFGFQGHPEASPGPHDARPLFDHFVELMAAARRPN
ncbi:MAG: glutamine-hydrolyzing carbamoyl-phosphate synthase small subunit [Pseudomonadota bacterium]